MNEYIFYTVEGFSQSPNGNELENFQILGFEIGKNEKLALKSLLQNNSWIKEEGFSIGEIRYNQIINTDTRRTVSNLYQKYETENIDPRVLLEKVLLELGVNKGQASLIALEAGGSQCKVTKKYLKDIKIPRNKLDEAYEAVKYFYTKIE